MKDLGEAHYILGIEIIRDPKTQKMFLRQRHKIEDIQVGGHQAGQDAYGSQVGVTSSQADAF